MGDASPQIAGQSARAGRADGWSGGRQYQRLRQGAQTDRRRDERLLCARVLLNEPRPHPEATAGRNSREKEGPGREPTRSDVPSRVHAQAVTDGREAKVEHRLQFGNPLVRCRKNELRGTRYEGRGAVPYACRTALRTAGPIRSAIV